MDSRNRCSMKRLLSSPRRLFTFAATLPAIALTASCTTNDGGTSEKMRNLAFWCHDHLGITEIHSPAMDDCIRRNLNRDLTDWQ